MQQSQIVFRFLAPTNEQATKPVDPAMGALNHPATCPKAFVLDFDSLFTAPACMRNQTIAGNHLTHFVIVIPLSMHSPDWRPCHACDYRARSSSVADTIFISWRLAPSMASATGMPFASVSRLRLTPPLARSVGLGPIFFPAQRGFRHGTIERQPIPVDGIERIKTE